MLEAMREIALQFIAEKKANGEIQEELFAWFLRYSEENTDEIFPFLVEGLDNIERVYTISPDKDDPDLVRLTITELSADNRKFFPFSKPSGSQSGQLGPILKRSCKPDKPDKIGPKEKIVNTTYKEWREYSQGDSPAAAYFSDILSVLARKKIDYLGKETVEWMEKKKTMLAYIISRMEEKRTTLLTVRNSHGLWPGESPEYIKHLQNILRKSKYETLATPAVTGSKCNLCKRENISVYSNGMKGAGINFANVDRTGAFFELNSANAWKNFAICGDCADLLYIFKNYAISRKKLECKIAGDNALLVPAYLKQAGIRMNRIMETYAEQLNGATNTHEERILTQLARDESLLNLNIYWVSIGQNIDDMKGAVTDIPPSRLREISKINTAACDWRDPVFPKYGLHDGYKTNLGLNGLKELLKKPGGKKVERINDSKLTASIRRNIACAIFYKKLFNPALFWEEIFKTAHYYMIKAMKDRNSWTLTNEMQRDNKKYYLTFAAWIKSLAFYLYYFKQLEVMTMENELYKPIAGILKPYFSEKSGIDSPEKAFAFILGVLYGRLLTIQGGKGVNVGANALTWLKRLTLKGADLPELYIKTREKLLAYEAESNENVRTIIHELGTLGVQLGDKINLDSVATNYFILLGQSVSADIIPSKNKGETNDRNKN